MSIVFILIPVALCLGGLFLASFVFAARSGQFDDLETPPYRILLEEQNLEADLKIARKELRRELN